MRRLNGFTMLEVVAVMFIVTAMALVAVPIGRSAMTHHEEREFIEKLIEEWEMLKMESKATGRNGVLNVKGADRQVQFATLASSRPLLKFPSSLSYKGETTIICNGDGKVQQAGSLNFKQASEKYWKVTFQLGWGRALFIETTKP